MDPTTLFNNLINVFLYLIFLSTIGAGVADVVGGWIRVKGKTKKFISTLFILGISFGWGIGIFQLLFGAPKLIPGLFLVIDNLGTSLIAGFGSGFVFDLFETLIKKLKRARDITQAERDILKGDSKAKERLNSLHEKIKIDS